MADDVDEVVYADAVVDGLVTPSSSDAYRALHGNSPEVVAAIAVKRALASGSVLSDGSVTTAKLAANAVTAAKVAADVATQAELDSGISPISGLWKNVKDPVYGAVGDGVANDTVAIQAAIDAAGNQGCVYFPKGNYLVTDQGAGFCLNISSYSGITLMSFSSSRANPSSTGGGATIFTSSASTKILKAEAVSLNHYGPRLVGIRLEDRGGSSTCYSISLFNNYTCRDCTFEGSGSGTGVGVLIAGANDASYGTFDNCAAHKNLKGITATGSVGYTVLSGYYSSSIASHILIETVSAHISIIGAKLEGNDATSGVGVQVPAGAGAVGVIGCNFEGCKTGVNLVAAGSPTYLGARVIGNSFVGSNATETGVSVGANRTSDQIIGNRFSNLATNVSDSGTGTVIFPTRLDGARTNEYMRLGGTSLLSGTGAPESAITAPVGSLYLRTDGGAGTTLYLKQTGTGNTGWTALGAGGNATWGRVTPTYSASITPDVSGVSHVKIVATDTSAFTINAPTNPVAGQIVFFQIYNNSGGTLGNVTWNSVFSTSWANPASKPANTHHSTLAFCYDDAANTWVQAGAGNDLA